MNNWIHDDILQIRHGTVSSYLLRDSESAVLIDTGFIGGIERIHRGMGAAGFDWPDVRAILLTHGHLDHTLNAARIKELSGAPLYAHEMETRHVLGEWRYKGLSRICGMLEAMGRALLGFRKPTVDRLFKQGDELPFLGGLRVVHLPGHTRGHCGFLSLKTGLLFSGDTHRNARSLTCAPWPWLNTDHKLVRQSILKVAQQPVTGILSNHCDRARPEEQLRRFRKLFT